MAQLNDTTVNGTLTVNGVNVNDKMAFVDEVNGSLETLTSDFENHTHNRLYHSDGNQIITIAVDSNGYYIRRFSTNENINLGSPSYPWYKTYTNRLEVLSERPVFKPTYDTTVTYATNCYIGTTGILSRTTNTSSKTIKHDIKELDLDSELSANKLYDVNVYQFKYDDGIITDTEDERYGKDLVGFIIEDLNEKYPIAVDKPSEDVREWSWNSQYLIPPMLKLIQEQKEEIEALKERVKLLENK